MIEVPTIQAGLESIALSVHKVVDPASIPGSVRVDPDPNLWRELDGHSAGLLRLFVTREKLPRSEFRPNLIVILTRAIVDNGVDLAVLGDHFLAESRRLTDWHEEQAQVWPPNDRHRGWCLQAGTYTDDGLSLYSVTQYALYQRANVGYLLQATATTTASERPQLAAEMDKVIANVNLDD